MDPSTAETRLDFSKWKINSNNRVFLPVTQDNTQSMWKYLIYTDQIHNIELLH